MSSVIKIQGNGQVQVKPDMMTFHCQLIQKKQTYGEAYDAMLQVKEKVVKEIKQVGFNVASLEASGIDVRSIEDRDQAYFVCIQSIQFTDRIEPVRMTKLLDALRDSDVHEISLSYSVKDASEATNDAIILAVNDATDRAKLIAENAGVRLSGIRNIEYVSSTPFAYRSVQSQSIQESELIIEKSVVIEWDIK